MWRCRYNSFRADGANGQYIIMIPDKNAVIVTTANIEDMQSEINLIWKHIYPALSGYDFYQARHYRRQKGKM